MFLFLELKCVINKNPYLDEETNIRNTVKMATNKPKNVRESEQKLLDAIVNGKRS